MAGLSPGSREDGLLSMPGSRGSSIFGMSPTPKPTQPRSAGSLMPPPPPLPPQPSRAPPVAPNDAAASGPFTPDPQPPRADGDAPDSAPGATPRQRPQVRAPPSSSPFARGIPRPRVSTDAATPRPAVAGGISSWRRGGYHTCRRRAGRRAQWRRGEQRRSRRKQRRWHAGGQPTSRHLHPPSPPARRT